MSVQVSDSQALSSVFGQLTYSPSFIAQVRDSNSSFAQLNPYSCARVTLPSAWPTIARLTGFLFDHLTHSQFARNVTLIISFPPSSVIFQLTGSLQVSISPRAVYFALSFTVYISSVKRIGTYL